MTSLSSFPDEVLLSEILPRLPLQTLINICATNSRLDTLCKDEGLWIARTQSEFPQQARMKPEGIPWKDYYLAWATGRLLPIYYNGDRIGSAQFIPAYFNIVISTIIPHIIQYGLTNTNILFVNRTPKSVVIVRYPELEMIVKNTDYDSIDRIIFFAGQLQDGDVTDLNLWYELVSPFGHPSVYGTLLPNNDLVLIEPEPIPAADIRSIRRGRKCSTYPRDYLIRIAQLLNIGPDLSRVDKKYICSLIQDRLKELGHLFSAFGGIS